MMDNQCTQELGCRTIDYVQLSFIEKVELGMKIVFEYAATTT